MTQVFLSSSYRRDANPNLVSSTGYVRLPVAAGFHPNTNKTTSAKHNNPRRRSSHMPYATPAAVVTTKFSPTTHLSRATHIKSNLEDETKTTMSSSEDEVEPTRAKYRGSLGTCFNLSDGSLWQVCEPLSHLKHQQRFAPFEGRQVFRCVLLEDPAGMYEDIEEAVVKVKYQIQGTDAIIKEHQDEIKRWEEAKAEYTEDDEFWWGKQHTKGTAFEHYDSELRQAREAFKNATEPVWMPNYYTTRELKAIRYLTAKGCAHTPRLLGWAQYTLDDENEIDEIAMPGGYLVYTLMTKAPGRTLYYWYREALSRSERDVIREAFKVALTDLWELGIKPCDRGLRNILWDQEGNKCYIVDFEEYEIIGSEAEKPTFDDSEYKFWGLAESGNHWGT